jgi:hypothetical protein
LLRSPPTAKSKFSFPYQITETPYIQETKKRHKDVAYPPLSGYCTSNHKDIEHGSVKGRKATGWTSSEKGERER